MPFASSTKVIVKNYAAFYDMVEAHALRHGFKKYSVNVSTILPKVSEGRALAEMFTRPVHLYYSLYSIDNAFRAKWLPNATPWESALARLADFQQRTGQPLTFHWALIKGENDARADAENIARALRPYGFQAKVNLVRFNAHESLPNEESAEARRAEILEIVRASLIDPERKSRVVPRVGNDVFASCGMFVEK